MVIARLIERKRDGGALSVAEWRELVSGYAAGAVPDYQMAALAMAILFRGLETFELVALTDAMLASGGTLPRPESGPARIDKHSTGGVGDNTSLLLAPMLASCGVKVPMMSGRGLGHTGGTLDKLESIPGFRTDLSLERAARQIDSIGVVMLGQTAEIAPADRRLYALRDVTGTVESIPLIAASIMSKKLAEGLDGLVLDVKVGSGAFLPELDRARQLALTMVALGERSGCRTVARLTAMDRPLASGLGNALEVKEAIAGLKGERQNEMMAVTFALGSEMLRLAGLASSEAEAGAILGDSISSGRALERLRELVTSQGGDPRVVDDPTRLPSAPVEFVVPTGQSGVMPALPPRALGELIVSLGGGRRATNDTIDPAVGLVIEAPPGTAVGQDDAAVRIHARSDDFAAAAAAELRRIIDSAWQNDDAALPLLLDRITAADIPDSGVLI